MGEGRKVRVAAVVAAVAVTVAIVLAITTFLDGLIALPVSRERFWWFLGFAHGLLFALLVRGLSRRSRRLRRMMRRRAATGGRWRP